MKFNFEQFDLANPNGHTLPKISTCPSCGNTFRYMPFVSMRYGNRNKTFDGMCNECSFKKTIEGDNKIKYLKDKVRNSVKDEVEGKEFFG